MPIGVVTAAIGAAGAIGSAVIGSNASKSAAQTQSTAGNAASQSFAPYTQGGAQAYNKALGMFGLGPGTAATSAPLVGSPAPSGPPPIPAGSGILPPGNPSTGQLTQYGPGWATYPSVVSGNMSQLISPNGSAYN